MLFYSQLFQPRLPLDLELGMLFAGREQEISRCLAILQEPDSFCVLYGDLGIGKSSLAWRVFDKLGASKATSGSSISGGFQPLWISCRDHLNIETVLVALLSESGADRNVTLGDVYPDILDEQEKSSVKQSFKVATGIIEYQREYGQSEDKDEIRANIAKVREAAGDDVKALFSRAVKRIYDGQQSRQNLVIFLDDFEKLQVKEGISSYLLSLHGVRFVIVGIAESPNELVDQNESIDRHLLERQIVVKPLSLDEVTRIFRIAENVVLVDHDYKELKFDVAFVNEVYDISQGQPLVAQFYGHSACIKRNVLELLPDYDVIIDVSAIGEVEKGFFSETGGEVQPSAVKNITEAVGNSINRASIVRKAARRFASWFSIGQLREGLDKNQRVNLEQHLDRLVQHRVLFRHDRDPDRYQFITPTTRMLCRRLPDKASMPIDPSS